MIGIYIMGCSGRMGRYTHTAINDSSLFTYCGGASQTHPIIQSDMASCDVIIDYSTPEALENNISAAVSAHTPYVCGVTGINNTHRDLLKKASDTIPVLYAANFSLGITLMNHLAAQAARALYSRVPADSLQVSIEEHHHAHKKDAPSGTALTLGSTVANAMNQRLESPVPVITQTTPQALPLSFSITRGGTTAGDHSVSYMWDQETLTIEHHAQSPMIFAHGALAAAGWLHTQSPGLYAMTDVIGL